jgi:hypothetical protein
MKFKVDDIWNVEYKYRCITTNGIVKPDGELVMGAGVALQAAKRYPTLPKTLGGLVFKGGNRVFFVKSIGIFSFPTKDNWRDNSHIGMIKRSARQLVALCDELEIKEKESVVLPPPGCGLGGLDIDDVAYEINKILDDRFTLAVPKHFVEVATV